MPFRFIALNRWQMTSFCNFPIAWPSSVRKSESKTYRVPFNKFLLKNFRKGDSSEAVFIASKFITARNER